eukprot:6765783-Karenia_brevis.AAC.1
MRRALGHQIFGCVSAANLWVPSALNPADDASRFVALRRPAPAPPWLAPLLAYSGDGWSISSRGLWSGHYFVGE